ncbi:MAG TPA: hypothetical protein VKU60_18050 [Chloroflexota bacterium]|nr:hypothetical protein [Chloroflexota bacterium]
MRNSLFRIAGLALSLMLEACGTGSPATAPAGPSTAVSDNSIVNALPQ